MPSCELEILYQAASCTGRNAGRIRWTPDSVPNTLTAGATHFQFSYDSARKEMYWLDFVHLGGVGEDVGELSVNCGWGFSAVGFQPSALYNQAA